MKYKRRRILTHSLQLRYSLYVAIAMVAVMFLTILNTYLDVVTLINTVLPEKGRDYILIWDLINPLLFIKILFITIVIILLGILLSHRFAGPIYRFTSVFQNIGRGELDMKEVKLRQKDALHDEADELNSMVEGLRGTVKDIKEDVNTLSLQANLSSEAKEIISRLKEKLSFFKT